MATLSSILAWRIPGMGEPGGLPSMGSHRVGHHWNDLAAAAAAAPIKEKKCIRLLDKGHFIQVYCSRKEGLDLTPLKLRASLVAQRLKRLPGMPDTWVGRSPGEGNGNPLQYSCLENPMDRRAWQATVHGVAKSRTRLSNFTLLHFHWNWRKRVFKHWCELVEKYWRTLEKGWSMWLGHLCLLIGTIKFRFLSSHRDLKEVGTIQVTQW